MSRMHTKILSVTPKGIKIEYITCKPVEIKGRGNKQNCNTIQSVKRKRMIKGKHKKRK